MKNIILLYSIFWGSLVFSQTQTYVDSTSILFKAKLFTISEYGIAEKKDVVKYLEEQEGVFLKSPYKNFIFLKIKFNQPYTRSDESTTTLLRFCDYYIVYNVIDCQFYRIGGFDSVDIDRFFEALKLREDETFGGLEGNKIEEIDIDCMYEYYLLSKKKRYKKDYSCFTKCSDITRTSYRDE